MTADAATLRALADRVEAGETIPQIELRQAGCIPFWGLPDSLDACAELHEAVLGAEWLWQIDSGGDVFGAGLIKPVGRFFGHDDIEVCARAETPARAWLAAILRARAAEMEAGDAVWDV